MKYYEVVAKTTGYPVMKCEAASPEDAIQLGENADGGEFESDDNSTWEMAYVMDETGKIVLDCRPDLDNVTYAAPNVMSQAKRLAAKMPKELKEALVTVIGNQMKSFEQIKEEMYYADIIASEFLRNIIKEGAELSDEEIQYLLDWSRDSEFATVKDVRGDDPIVVPLKKNPCVN